MSLMIEGLYDYAHFWRRPLNIRKRAEELTPFIKIPHSMRRTNSPDGLLVKGRQGVFDKIVWTFRCLVFTEENRVKTEDQAI